MRICFYLENYVAGGVDSVLVNTINNWPDDSDEIFLVCNPTNEGLNKILKKSISRDYKVILSSFVLSQDVSDSDLNSFTKFLLKPLWYYGEYLIYITYIFKLKQIFVDLNPDVIFIHNGGYPGAATARMAVIAGKFAGVKKIFMVVHNLAIKSPSLKIIPEYIVDRLVEKNAKMICVSNKGEFELKSNRYFYDDAIIIHNGIESENRITFNNNMSRPDLNLSEKDILIGMVGSFEKRKGHKVLFESLSILHSFKMPFNIKCFIIGGGGNDEVQIEKMIDEYRLNDIVSLCGFVPNVMEYYHLFDIFVLPSINYESCPMVILEAMSEGLPIIATDTGGVKEIVMDGINGYVVPPNNPMELTKALKTLLTDSQIRIYMGKNSKKIFLEKFEAKKMANRYYELTRN